jgi:hypothetical protein
MVKSMKKMMRNSTHKKMKTARKRNHKKSGKSMRKNIKHVSLKKHHRSHKKNVYYHHSRGIHNNRRPVFGGKKMKGGMVSSPSAGPVGYSWQGGNEASWPGVGASHGINTNGVTMSNHFSLSPNGIVVGGVDLARSTSDDNNISPPMNGGKKKRHAQKGGFFQEIVNLGRGAQYGVNGGYFGLVGKQQPLSQNPYPTEQPINNDSSALKGLAAPPDVRQIFVNANNSVGKI